MAAVDVEELYKHEKKKEERPLTKIVIRRLPTSMTLETFLDQVSPIPEHNYFNFIKANDPSLGMDNYSRAYLNFTNPDDITAFKQKFDDYVFLDSKGREFPAVVEFAPYQRIKPKSIKKDPKSGTIEDDAHFKEFKEQLELELENKKNVQPLNQYYFNMKTKDNEEEVTSTPLLEFVKNRRLDSLKRREEKREERRKKELERKKIKDDQRKIRLEQIAKMKAESEKKRMASIAEAKATKGRESSKLTSLKRTKVTKPEVKTKEVTTVKEKRAIDITEKSEENPISTKKIPLQGDQENKLQNVVNYVNQDEVSINLEKEINCKEDCEEKSSQEMVKIFDENQKEEDSEGKTNESGDKLVESEPQEKVKILEENGQMEKVSDFQNTIKTHDESEKESNNGKEIKSREEEQQASKDKNEEIDKEEKKDPRTERRLKNKDRPTIQIYRPGMGKFSRQRLNNNDQ